jgi:hypothetical protein
MMIDFSERLWFVYSAYLLSVEHHQYAGLLVQNHFPDYFNLNIIGLVSLCIPGFCFTRWLNKQPREKSVKMMTLAAAIITSLIAYPLSNLVLDGYTIQSVGPWVIAVFVILPVMGRNGSFIDSDKRTAFFSNTPEHLIHDGWIRPGRYEILGNILGVVALCIPTFAFVYNPLRSGGDIGLDSPVWAGFYSGDMARFELWGGVPFVLTYLLGITSIVFAYSILQYLQTQIDRTRVFTFAALSILAPYGFYMVTPPFVIVIPVPVLLLVGLPVVFVLKQIPPRQVIWEDKKIRVWYEVDHEREVKGTQPSVLLISRSDSNATVKVPFTYRIASKIRSLCSPKTKSNSDTDPSEAD